MVMAPILSRTIQMRNNFVLFVKIAMSHRFVGLERPGCFVGVVFERLLRQKQHDCVFGCARVSK